MKCSKSSFSVAAVLLVALLPLSSGTLARDADSASTSLAAAHTARQQCLKVCRARYRDCISLKQIPNFECRGVHQDCVRNTCEAVRG
jgi:hypothetical protein